MAGGVQVQVPSAFFIAPGMAVGVPVAAGGGAAGAGGVAARRAAPEQVRVLGLAREQRVAELAAPAVAAEGAGEGALRYRHKRRATRRQRRNSR